jgi:hypothetical protein
MSKLKIFFDSDCTKLLIKLFLESNFERTEKIEEADILWTLA